MAAMTTKLELAVLKSAKRWHAGRVRELKDGFCLLPSYTPLFKAIARLVESERTAKKKRGTKR
jgi:hypothetical protein